jgi:hypothetical protein
MSDQVYKDMIDVMNGRGGVIGGQDIPEYYTVVKALFTPEEAEINNAMLSIRKIRSGQNYS